MFTLIYEFFTSPFEEARINSLFLLVLNIHLLDCIYSVFPNLSVDFYTRIPDIITSIGSSGFVYENAQYNNYSQNCSESMILRAYTILGTIMHIYLLGFFESNYIALIIIVSLVPSFHVLCGNKVVLYVYKNISDFVYYNMVYPYLGVDGKKYFPFFLYLFLFIFFSNIFGLIPGFFAVTSHLSVTLFLSTTCWLSILLVGLYIHGIRFFASFYPSKVPFILSPFLMCIEFISYIVRLASLSLRLFANIVAGHILLDTISMFFFYMNMSVDTSFSIDIFIVGLSM
jgi:ATP synthase subunit 6